ncbi:GNAT family N-acetyltransferase [Endozoicomonas sp. ALE010]|uniref:GNAT family N-acetyltransferase n=1 Tax=Endozoicomonas sp. ALE010 TaxID=3403081 RepID=UPI003BB62CEB
MNPIIELASCTKAVSDIALPYNLILEARFKGYKISVVPNVSDISYIREYFYSKNLKVSPIKGAKKALKKIDTAKNSNKRVIELIDISAATTAAYLSFKLNQESISIELLSVKKSYQGNGLGKLLMKSIIEVAASRKVPGIVLNSDYDAISFYEKFGFKKVKTGESEPLMKLATPVRDYLRQKSLEHYDLICLDKQLLSPIQYKKV